MPHHLKTTNRPSSIHNLGQDRICPSESIHARHDSASLSSVVDRQFLPILIQPPEEEECDGCPEDAPDGDEAIGVVAAVVEMLHEIQKEPGSKSSDNGGERAQESVGRTELTVAIMRQDPHIHWNHHGLGENSKRQVRRA